MQINIEKTLKLGVQVNDLFKVEDDYFMLVKTASGYALPSICTNEYLSEGNSELNVLEDVEDLIAKVREFHGIEHFSQNIYDFELNIKSK